MNQNIFITKADGTTEPFEVAKLEESLMRAGASRTVADQVIAHVSSELSDGMTTHEIYKHAFDILHKQERPVALRYSLKKAVMELGPSGFPFEKYVAEIFKAKGFETLVDQDVHGHCVTHEMDVVAWNDDKLIMVEAKFHNDPIMKSDLKVILYVTERADDLRAMKFTYGGRERELSEAWLVTNTKFSSAAIEYGSCQGGIVMVGWDYPPKDNLHDMLIQYKLHPVTCLTSINGREKKALLEQGMVLCKSLIGNPAALIMAGVEKSDIEKVFAEIELL